MAINTAIVVQKPGEAKVVEASVPKLRDDYLIVKVKAVALNPTDWKHVDWLTSAGARIGCDFSGIVEEIGSAVTKPWKKGDRICGFAHGGNEVYHEDGAFQEYITVKGDLQIPIPENLSFEEAATLGVGISTVGQALYQSLAIPLPTSPITDKQYLLIYGGSTATGALAIQFGKLSGYTVITTCSPHSNSYVKSLGASEAFDYNSPTCAADIRKYTSDGVKLALDCISEGQSPTITASSLSPEGGIYTSLLPVPAATISDVNPKIENKSTLAYTILGEEFKFGPNTVPAVPENMKFAKTFWELAAKLLGEGKVKVHRFSVDKYGKGLEGALEGMAQMKQGKVSGEKLVFTL